VAGVVIGIMSKEVYVLSSGSASPSTESSLLTVRYDSLSATRINEAAALAAQSLRENPAYCDIFRLNDNNEFGEEQYQYTQQCLEVLFKAHFALINKYHPENLRGAVIDESDTLVCFFIMESSLQQPYSLWDKISFGYLSFVYFFGWNGFTRLMKAANIFDKRELDLYEDSPRLQLQRMVTLDIDSCP
jgi:hypothetical protein